VVTESKILFTGGSGLLGQEIRALCPSALYPSSQDLDVSRWQDVEAYSKAHQIELVVHAAAFTSPPRIDEDPVRAIESNVIGTSNIVKLCVALGCRLIYISTDYVFKGDRGNYDEQDALSPVNKYAWSKLGGECAARLYDRSLIVRTSFGPDEFPFPKAFVDQWTSRQSVSVVAKKLVRLWAKDITGVVHVGGPRRTVLDYARDLDPSKKIDELSIHDVQFTVPVDTSLDCREYDRLVRNEDA
jgi:dTDP-4-dehydrorhamnose reductase